MLSIIFPIRNEFPQATWTVYSLINDVPEGEDFEVILAANGSDEKNLKWLEWFQKGKLAKRGLLRVVSREQPGLWESLRMGFEAARGDLVCWGCGHISVRHGSIPAMMELVKKEKGIVHSPMLWMGDYSEDNKWKCMQYKDPIYRGWSFQRLRDTPYTVCSSGGGLSMVDRREWFNFGGGVESNMTLTGGGETFMDMKWWLMGSKIWVHPEALYYHWAYEREWHRDKYEKEDIGWNNKHFRNQIIALYCIGGEKWVERIFGDKIKQYKLYSDYYEEIKEKCKPEREFILKHQVYDGLDGLFKAEPWECPKKAVYKSIKSY